MRAESLAVPRNRRGRRRMSAVLGATVLALIPFLVAPPPAHAADPLLSQGRPATASSVEGAGTPASAAVDGNPGTRWASQFADPQWIQVDLGTTATVTQVVLQWEAAYARSFQIQTSTNGSTWTTIHSTTTGTGGTQTIPVTGSGRYVRVLGTVRATAYGYSLWEFQVFGTTGSTPTCGTGNAAQGRPAAASSTENAGTPASAAFDGNAGTRWSSQFSDPQWIRVDLGSTQTICRVTLQWEAAYARSFQIQVSADASAWTTIHSTTTATGGTQTIPVTGSGRYVRVNGTVRATAYGYSLWEFAVAVSGSGPVDPVEPTDPFNPDLGPNTSSSTRRCRGDHPEPAQHRLQPAGDQPVRPAAVRAAVQAGHLQRRRQRRLLHPGRSVSG